MTKKELYLAMKPHLMAVKFEAPDDDEKPVANVAIWRNQVTETTNYTGPYPAIFVEFLNTEYNEASSKVYQNYDPVVRLHLCLSTSADEAHTLAIFNFANETYKAMHLRQYGDFSPMKRRAETTVFNYNTVQDYMQDYALSSGKDYGADKRLTLERIITDIKIEPDLTNDI